VGRVKWDQALSDDSSDAVTDDDSGRTRETVLQKTAKVSSLLQKMFELKI
jgi:hypothetical protein